MADRNYTLSRSVNSSAAIKEILDGIAEECKLLLRQVMVNHDIDSDSKIYNDIEVKSDGNGLIEILVNDYIDYIQGGRKAFGKVPKKEREPGTFPPVEEIAKWAADKGIETDNGVAWAICQSIYENGIKPRPIFEIPDGLWTNPMNDNDLFFDICDEMWDDWSQQILNAATEELDKQFDNTFKNQK